MRASSTVNIGFSMTSSSLRVHLLAIVACVIATPLAAQMATPDAALADVAPVVAPAVPSAGPTIASTTLGYSNVADASSEMTWNNQRRSKNSSGPVLAIVGGAAVIGGLLIGDDAGTAIAVGGLVMGLIGLYLWLK
jgi:hypothetical protein